MMGGEARWREGVRVKLGGNRVGVDAEGDVFGEWL